MEDLLAQERVAEQHVYGLLKDPSAPLGILLQGYDTYRQLCQANILADFASAEKREAKLWQAHTEGRKFFSRNLKNLRKAESEQPVAIRSLIKLFLTFLKDSEKFYRGYIHALSETFGGIPELEAIAQSVKTPNNGGTSESSPAVAAPKLRVAVLGSCHQALIYLGDLSRYRASDKLDKEPKYGPALGYYGLACTIQPASGLGYHQQAVIALEQKDHLRAAYNLYRAIVVENPHPNAMNNLKLEFEKVSSAFKKGELIPMGSSKDPQAPRRVLEGWFVRMHGLCFAGEQFKGHDELENELLGHLAAIVKQPALNVDSTLMRMVVVNLAAQYNAMERFKESTTVNWQMAFFWFLRLNLRTYTRLLDIFNSGLSVLRDSDEIPEEPVEKLTPALRRILPLLRLYSAWLSSNVHIIAGLAEDDALSVYIDDLWRAYSRAVAAVADDQIFGIWTLEEYRAEYMLEEDADVLGFKPLQNEWTKIWRNWYDKASGTLKPKFSDAHIARMLPEEEMLARLMGLLDDGLHLAHDVDEAPISLLGTKVHYGQPPEEDVAAFEKAQQDLKDKPWPKPKPLSYAAAAAKSRARQAQKQASIQASTPAKAANGPPASSAHSRQAQLSRMVDELLDEEEGNNPVTPPQQHALHPAVVPDGDSYMNGTNSMGGTYYGGSDFANVPSYQPKLPSTSLPRSPRAAGAAATTPSAFHTPKGAVAPSSLERMQSVSTIWNKMAANAAPTSPSFPSGLPTGTLSSPAQIRQQGHSRGNSASSIRSRNSQNAPMGDSWSSLGSAPGVQASHVPNDGYSRFSASGDMASPLLFGAGNNMWSTSNSSFRNISPPNGQGG